jgi:hypothetical protein
MRDMCFEGGRWVSEPRLVLNGGFRIIGVQPLGYSVALLVNLHFYGTFTGIH